MMEPVPPRDLEFVDSHVHFWDPQARRYAWLDGQPSLRRRFGPEDYGGGGRVAALIFVQADCRDDEALDEVRWAAELAARDPRVRGIVAYAPSSRAISASRPSTSPTIRSRR
jgi:L-fuconolactonase